MPKENRVDNIEKEKRIHEVSLLLRRKSIPFIIQFITKEWDIGIDQARNYISLARREWEKYFLNLKNAGMSYHVSQLRELKDQAYEKEVVIGSGDNKKTVTIADLGLVFEITKEEGKLMGIYPKERVEHSGEVKLGLNLEGMEIGEIRKLIRALEAHTGAESQGGVEEEGGKGGPV